MTTYCNKSDLDKCPVCSGDLQKFTAALIINNRSFKNNKLPMLICNKCDTPFIDNKEGLINRSQIVSSLLSLAIHLATQYQGSIYDELPELFLDIFVECLDPDEVYDSNDFDIDYLFCLSLINDYLTDTQTSAKEVLDVYRNALEVLSAYGFDIHLNEQPQKIAEDFDIPSDLTHVKIANF